MFTSRKHRQMSRPSRLARASLTALECQRNLENKGGETNEEARNGMKKAKHKAARRRPKQKGRPKLGTPDWTRAFLAALECGFHIRDACGEACVHPAVAYRKRGSDAAFKAAWNDARRMGTDALEAEAVRRAYHGALKPVFYKGRTIGHIRVYSDQLLMFLLRAREPKKYRDNSRLEQFGGGPTRIVGVYTVAPSTFSPDSDSTDTARKDE